ncbi:hypothetical protein [Terricaulis sp.]|uniref:hypothetical protein n=1 Tax=Terricaulis sp. TaxID=2768686 RepID=UPI002AC4E370|nr:hypothetical protein [Terricaulis sp.]MDZ4692469.1 hypothetical protein [Terricaulis sp.]
MLRRTRLISGLVAIAAFGLVACGQTEQSAPDDNASVPGAAAPAEEAATRDTGPTEFCAEVGRRVSPEDCADFAALADDAEQGSAAFNAPDPMERGQVHTLQLAISYAPAEEEPAEAVPPDQSGTPAPSVQFESSLSSDQRRRLASQLQELRAERQQLEQLRTTAPADERVQLEARQAAIDTEIRSLNVQMAPTRSAAAPTPAETVDPLSGETVEFTPLVGRFMRAELVGNGFEITPLSPASQEVLPDSVTTWNWRVVANEGGRRSLTLRTVVEGCTADGQCYPLRSTSRNYDVTVTVGLIGQARDLLTEAPTWLRLLAGVLTALAVLVGAWFGLRSAFKKGRSES